MKNYSPIVLIGMHRSGTSMLTTQLQRLGLFMGVRKDVNEEAIFFQQCNSWMMQQAGARWDNPEFTDLLLQDRAARLQVVDYITLRCAAPAVSNYAGWREVFRRGGVYPSWSRPWGWKDPCNVYTLPIWLDLFPEAKVICITRHGVDVASSLFVREQRGVKRIRARYERLRPVFRFLPKRKGFVDSLRCRTLEGSFDLWRLYVERCHEHVGRLASDRCLSLKYEDVLQSPQENLARVAAFSGLKVDDKAIAKLAGNINPSRAYSYRKKAELVEFAHRNADILNMAGYEA